MLIWDVYMQPIYAEKMNSLFYFLFILFMNALYKITASLVVCLFLYSNHLLPLAWINPMKNWILHIPVYLWLPATA